MTASVKTNDKRLIADVNNLLQWLWTHPNAVVIPTVTFEDTASVAEDKATAMSTAAEQLNALASTDYEAMRIQYILSHSELDDTLFRQIAAAILLYPDRTVQLRLKNNQIIEKE